MLVADTGGPGGGISCYAGVQAPRSLVEVADHVAAGLPVGRLFTATAGLRVLATGPRFTPACAREGIELLLAYAREHYALTVIDCGTLAREADQVALASASHIAWVLPASTSGMRRARPVLEAINPYLPGRELIVARHDGGKAPLRELKRLAERRHAPLVLLPSVPDLATRRPEPGARSGAGAAAGDHRSARTMSRLTLTARSLHTHGAATAAPTGLATPRRSQRAVPDDRDRDRAAHCDIAILAFAGVLIVAAIVHVALAGHARAWLGYRFPGLPARPNVAVGIFSHNARAILGVFGLLLVAQLAARRPGGPGRAQRLILAGGELILTGMIAANVLVVGAGLGAYGERMARAELPHGPVELAAYALALALYLQGRRRALPRGHLTKGVAASVALLALAATLETFVERMRPLRVLLVLLLIGGGVGASLVLVSKAARSLHGSPLFQISPSTTTATPGRPTAKPPGASERRRPRHTSGRPPAPRHPAPGRPAASPGLRPAPAFRRSHGLGTAGGGRAGDRRGPAAARPAAGRVRAAATATAQPPRVRAV